MQALQRLSHSSQCHQALGSLIVCCFHHFHRCQPFTYFYAMGFMNHFGFAWKKYDKTNEQSTIMLGLLYITWLWLMILRFACICLKKNNAHFGFNFACGIRTCGFWFIWQWTNHSWSSTSTCAVTFDKKSIGSIIFKGTTCFFIDYNYPLQVRV